MLLLILFLPLILFIFIVVLGAHLIAVAWPILLLVIAGALLYKLAR